MVNVSQKKILILVQIFLESWTYWMLKGVSAAGEMKRNRRKSITELGSILKKWDRGDWCKYDGYGDRWKLASNPRRDFLFSPREWISKVPIKNELKKFFLILSYREGKKWAAYFIDIKYFHTVCDLVLLNSTQNWVTRIYPYNFFASRIQA